MQVVRLGTGEGTEWRGGHDFEEVYREAGPQLWRTLYGVCGGRTDLAEEAIAEAFARAIERGDRVRDPIAYVYSPAFLQVLQPIRILPWQAFMAVWTGILLGALVLLTGRRWLAVGVVLALMELAGGNIHLLLAAAIVLGFRWPWAWSLVLLTKITPGIGLLWFVVRQEWRNLAIALAGTAAIVAVSFLLLPDAWFGWAEVLSRVAGRDGTWAAVPIPFVLRFPVALAIVVWGAWTGRRWTVPVAGMLALPALWYGGLSMLLAVIAVRETARTTNGSGSVRAA